MCRHLCVHLLLGSYSSCLAYKVRLNSVKVADHNAWCNREGWSGETVLARGSFWHHAWWCCFYKIFSLSLWFVSSCLFTLAVFYLQGEKSCLFHTQWSVGRDCIQRELQRVNLQQQPFTKQLLIVTQKAGASGQYWPRAAQVQGVGPWTIVSIVSVTSLLQGHCNMLSGTIIFTVWMYTMSMQ